MKIKRVFAYIIDLLIVSIIATLIFRLPMFKDNYERYVEYNDQDFQRIFSGGSSDMDEDELIALEYNISTSSKPLLIIRLGVLVIYFGVIPFLWNGQTFGKKIMKLKVAAIDGELNPGLFMLRSILVSNFIPSLLNVLILMFFDQQMWYEYVGYVGYLQYILIFLMLGFVIFREDERGLHDIICRTSVISTKEKK